MNSTTADRVLRLVGQLVPYSPFSIFARRYYQSRRNIVFYHGVWAPNSDCLEYFGGLDLNRFRHEIAQIENFMEFRPLEDVISDSANGKVGKKPTVALTFDDGMNLLESGVAEFLASERIRATVFVNTASVGYERLMWQHVFSAVGARLGTTQRDEMLATLHQKVGTESPFPPANDPIRASRFWPMARKDEFAHELWQMCSMPNMEEFINDLRPYMSWSQLEAWGNLGHTIGLHTHSHPFCSRIGATEIEEEILTPAKILKKRFGLEDLPFAYPFGARLPPDLERTLSKLEAFSCLLGTGQIFSPFETSPMNLGRVEAEGRVPEEVLARPILRSTFHSILGRN